MGLLTCTQLLQLIKHPFHSMLTMCAPVHLVSSTSGGQLSLPRTFKLNLERRADRMYALRFMTVMAITSFLPGIAVGLVDKTRGEVFAVGGAAGWRVPQTGMVNYTEWAAMLSTLNVGDTLLFTYPTGEHNVVQVGEEDFRRCRATMPIATYTDGQTLVNLPREGRYWFICGVRGHCLLGQKFVVDVVVPAYRAPAPAPTSGGSPQFGGPDDSRNPRAASPDSALAPVASLSISPTPSAFGPSAPNPDNSTRAMRVQVFAIAMFSLVGFFLI